MRKLPILLALVAGLFVTQARADFTGKNAAAATITFKNPGDCTSVVCVPVFQLYDGTNVVTLTTAGADAAANTLTGLPTYSRMVFFNGTTWDRWQGAVTATLAAETTKVIGTVRVASGGVASGSFASGSIASGALASGSIAAGALAIGSAVDGWNLTQGAIADAAVTAGATGTDSAKLRAISRDIGTVATNSALPLPTQSSTVPIGGTSLCDGANGTTNPCTTAATVKAASTPAAASDKALVVDQRPGTNVTVGPYPATAVPYTATATGTTGATTATLAGASSVTTYICGFSIRANATAAATGNATVTGVITATLNFTQWTAPNASGLGITEMIFSPCVPASTTNTSIAVVSAAPGTGGVVSVTAWGYKL